MYVSLWAQFPIAHPQKKENKMDFRKNTKDFPLMCFTP